MACVVGAIALVGVAVLAGWATHRWLLAMLFALGAAALWLIVGELRLRCTVHALAREAQRLAGAEHAQSATTGDPARLLDGLQDALRRRLANERELLVEESQRRERTEEELRETKERYTLAVSGANDGMWEWNLKTDVAYFSARWKSMLGFDENEIGTGIDEWRNRIHPQDRERVEYELDAHLAGRSDRFEYEHRLQQKDGSWRWVLTRAAAVRHASGKAYRLVGLNTDIHARKQVQEVLIELADGFNGLQGTQAFGVLVQRFANLIGAREAFLCECCNQLPSRVRMLAYWSVDRFLPGVEFDLPGTPCEEVITTGRPVVATSGAGLRWPGARACGVESYVALPCIDTKGVVIGHIACKDSQALRGSVPPEAILKLFAVRAECRDGAAAARTHAEPAGNAKPCRIGRSLNTED